MDEKTVNKYLRRRFSPMGWTLVGYYFVMTLLVLLSMLRGEIQAELGQLLGMETALPDPTGDAWGYILATGVALVVAWSWKGGTFWQEELLHREKPFSIKGVAAMLCLCMGLQMVNTLWISLLEGVLNAFGLSLMDYLEQVSGQSDTVSMFLYSAVLAPLSEEIFFRGYLLRSLKPYGKRFAIVASAALFGLFHGNLLQTPYAFAVGLLLGYVTVEYSIFWAVGIHVFNNLVLADLLSRVLLFLPEIAAGLLNLLIFGGAFVAAVGILIYKRRQIRQYRQGEWIDRRVLRCFFLNPGVLALTALMLASMIAMFFSL